MRPISITAMLLCLTACARDKAADATRATAADTGPAIAAAAVANAIAAKPAASDSILKANGHTADSFEALMYDIARDSAMSVAYAGARKK